MTCNGQRWDSVDTLGRTVKPGQAEILEQAPVVQGSLCGMTILMEISLYETYLSPKLLEPQYFWESASHSLH